MYGGVNIHLGPCVIAGEHVFLQSAVSRIVAKVKKVEDAVVWGNPVSNGVVNKNKLVKKKIIADNDADNVRMD